jgi:hypothetical protein
MTPEEIRDEQFRRSEMDRAVRDSGATPDQKMAYYKSQDMLAPIPTHHSGEVWDDWGARAMSAANTAMLALDSLGRGRDAAFRAVQEVNRPIINLVEGRDGTVRKEGNWNPGAALWHLASIPSNIVAPLTGERVVGGYGEPDDWRQYASPGNAMVIDMATDPGNWIPLPSVGAAKNGLKALGGGLRASKAIQLIDTHGNAVRQLMGAQ